MLPKPDKENLFQIKDIFVVDYHNESKIKTLVRT